MVHQVLPTTTKDEIDRFIQNVTRAHKSVGGRKSAAKSAEKRKNLMEIQPN